MCKYFKLNSVEIGCCLSLILNILYFFIAFFLVKYLFRYPIYHYLMLCAAPSLSDSQKLLVFFFYYISLIWGSLIVMQWIYIIPLIIIAKRERQWEMQQGVIMGSIITALLTGSCFVDVIRCHFH